MGCSHGQSCAYCHWMSHGSCPIYKVDTVALLETLCYYSGFVAIAIEFELIHNQLVNSLLPWLEQNNVKDTYSI